MMIFRCCCRCYNYCEVPDSWRRRQAAAWIYVFVKVAVRVVVTNNLLVPQLAHILRMEMTIDEADCEYRLNAISLDGDAIEMR